MRVEGISAVVLWIGVVFAFASFFFGMINAFIMSANRKDDVPLLPTWQEDPYSILNGTAFLTERGLKARRRCIFGFVGFVAIVGITVVGVQIIENFLHPTT